MSINPRDQLADLLSEHVNYWDHDHRAAVHAVIAEGWRPPPRVITTVDELDALPDGSVVLHDKCSDEIGSACLWVKGCGMWSTNGHDAEYDSEDLISHCDPGETLTVLHEPEEGQS